MAGGVRAALGSGAWAGVAWRVAPAARSYCSSLGTSTCRGRADGLEEGAWGALECLALLSSWALKQRSCGQRRPFPFSVKT